MLWLMLAAPLVPMSRSLPHAPLQCASCTHVDCRITCVHAFVRARCVQVVTYGAVTRRIPESLGMVTLESLSRLPGVVCDGLIGMDLLSSAPVLWDGPEGVAVVGARPDRGALVTSVPMRLLGGSTPVVQAALGAGCALSAACIFDT
jgi:hypothetical protein